MASPENQGCYNGHELAFCQSGDSPVNFRTYQERDEAHQVAIYNEAARDLPKFKASTEVELARRSKDPSFSPDQRLFAVEGDKVVAYAQYQANGRVSYPWCQRGYEQAAEPLFQHMLRGMREKGFRKVFAAYRADWQQVQAFFAAHGFGVAREIKNYVLDVYDMPTAPARRHSNITPAVRADVPAIFALAPHMLRCGTPQELERHLFDNPYLPPSAVFVLRSRTTDLPLAAGVLVTDSTYADPKAVDPAMPCFRLGAFGTEGMTTKRIKGLFSFVAREDGQLTTLGMELMGHASSLLEDSDGIDALAGQVPSDAPMHQRFYQMNFRAQGGFPVLERALS